MTPSNDATTRLRALRLPQRGQQIRRPIEKLLCSKINRAFELSGNSGERDCLCEPSLTTAKFRRMRKLSGCEHLAAADIHCVGKLGRDIHAGTSIWRTDTGELRRPLPGITRLTFFPRGQAGVFALLYRGELAAGKFFSLSAQSAAGALLFDDVRYLLQL